MKERNISKTIRRVTDSPATLPNVLKLTRALFYPDLSRSGPTKSWPANYPAYASLCYHLT